MLLILIGLGNWQVYRLHWKDGILAQIAAAEAAPPVPLGPEPAPFTTIAWRLAHVIVGVFAMRNHSHFGGPPADYESWHYATDAKTAVAQLDDAYKNWIVGIHGLDDRDLARPIGPKEGPWAEHSMAELILHINREAIHHGAEIACIRDLYLHTTNREGK